MKSHVLRPIWVVIGAIVLIQAGRFVMVPSDFGLHGKSFTYNYYRLSNIDEWKAFEVKYKGKETCSGEKCHNTNVEENLLSHHKVVECENCHGPNLGHPEDPKKLPIDRSRSLCIKCHGYLPYPDNRRSEMRTIDPQKHYIDKECSECHNPHKSNIFTEVLRGPHKSKLREIK
jgi:hypothetical protein